VLGQLLSNGRRKLHGQASCFRAERMMKNAGIAITIGANTSVTLGSVRHQMAPVAITSNASAYAVAGCSHCRMKRYATRQNPRPPSANDLSKSSLKIQLNMPSKPKQPWGWKSAMAMANKSAKTPAIKFKNPKHTASRLLAFFMPSNVKVNVRTDAVAGIMRPNQLSINVRRASHVALPDKRPVTQQGAGVLAIRYNSK
jgi:hypothetical protein